MALTPAAGGAKVLEEDLSGCGCFAKCFSALGVFVGRNCVIIVLMVIVQIHFRIPLGEFTKYNSAAHHMKTICTSFCKFYCVNFFFWVK